MNVYKIKTPLTILFYAGITVLIAGCNLPAPLHGVSIEPVISTPFGEATLSSSGSETETPISQSPEEIEVTLTATTANTPAGKLSELMSATPELNPIPCDRAVADVPIDLNYPDDTRVNPGEKFTKTWRIINQGSCEWSESYGVVWFSGDNLGVSPESNLVERVSPGEKADISVDMAAPLTPGVYSSYWMLKNEEGDLFGIGPHGNAPFWVRIQVVAIQTDTPQATIIPTPTPVLNSSGLVELENELTFDVDSGLTNQGEEDDFQLVEIIAGTPGLLPLNNSRMGYFGGSLPSQVDCQTVTLSDESIALEDLEIGDYLCLRSSMGLPGWVRILDFSTAEVTLNIEYLSWVVP